MLTSTPAARKNAAYRQRRARVRRRQGMASYRIEAHEHRLAEALIASGRLSEDAALRRALIEAELGALVEDWIARWLVDRHA
jgi:hypothetical protein